MAFSAAGSQAGGDGGGGTPGGQQQMNPMMTGGNMSAFDPRMSMMGMPMMGSPMGMGMGMPMQMTGMSTFDPRLATPGSNSPPAMNMNDHNGLMPPGNFGGLAHGANQYSSRTSSPAGRGSPARRGSPLTHSTPDARPSSPRA